MELLNQFIVLGLDENRFAIAVPSVRKVIPAVEITPLPAAPEAVLGVINLHGSIIPVADIRKRFRLPSRELSLTDRIIVAVTKKGLDLGIVADSVSTVVEFPPPAIVNRDNISSGLDYIEGAVRTSDGIILIHDVDTFFSLEEEKAIHEALKGMEGEN